jgi:predicted MFS family arabinose efflux permease
VGSGHEADTTQPHGISAGVLFMLSMVAAVAAGSLYYVQPLLSLIAEEFRTPLGVAGLLVTATQIGYVVGLSLVVPLGDLLEQRRILSTLLGVSALALVGAGLAPGFGALLAILVVMGVSASAAQVAVPLAAHLALPERRGRATGTVMSGLLLGILLARTVSGALAQFISWRAVFFAAAAVEVVLAGLVWRTIPKTPPVANTSYGGLLLSVVHLVRSSGVLRARMALGFLSMCGFSAMWTSLTFLLAGDGGTRYDFGEAVIGIFGLAGAAGALGARLVGRLADRGRVRLAATVAWLLVALGWGLLAGGVWSIAALIAGLIVFDLGIQAIQISNQHAIFTVHPEARSRVTTAYMTSYFAGGVLGSLVSGFAYQAGGWLAVCGFGLGTAALGLVVWAVVGNAESKKATSSSIARR